jgi:hypothetical protein
MAAIRLTIRRPITGIQQSFAGMGLGVPPRSYR